MRPGARPPARPIRCCTRNWRTLDSTSRESPFSGGRDLNQVIVLGLLRREPGVDFKTVTEADLEGLPDPEVLALAAAEGRILVSHDLRSMPDHFATFVQTAASPGVFLIPQNLPVAVALEQLLLPWSASEPSEWINQIIWLPL